MRDYGFNDAWRHIATRANGQLAVGCYTFEPDRRRWVASVLNVLTLDGDRIAEVTGFVTAELLSRWGEEDDRFVGATVFPASAFPPSCPAEGSATETDWFAIPQQSVGASLTRECGG